jgi:hypothetical protein
MAKIGPGIMILFDSLSHKHGSNKAQTTNYEHVNMKDDIDKHKYGPRVLT